MGRKMIVMYIIITQVGILFQFHVSVLPTIEKAKKVEDWFCKL